jgi:hypothetical protein
MTYPHVSSADGVTAAIVYLLLSGRFEDPAQHGLGVACGHEDARSVSDDLGKASKQF